jgi:hypothetical protein
MTYYTPSTRLIERSPPTGRSTLTLVCRSCGDTMQNLRSIPKLGVRREQLVFVCSSRKAVDTKELNGTEQARCDANESSTAAQSHSLTDA